jgi:hypothetical protein
MTSTAAALEERATNAAEAVGGPASTIQRNMMHADDAGCTEMAIADNPVLFLYASMIQTVWYWNAWPICHLRRSTSEPRGDRRTQFFSGGCTTDRIGGGTPPE